MENHRFDLTTNFRPKSDESHEWPRRQQHRMMCSHERHTPSCIPSWTTQHGKFTIYQELTPGCVKQLFQVTEKSSTIRDWSLVWSRLIAKNLSGDWRVYYVTKRLRLGIWKIRNLKDLIRIDGKSLGNNSRNQNIRRDQNIFDRTTVWIGAVLRKDHLRDNAQRQKMGRRRKNHTNVRDVDIVAYCARRFSFGSVKKSYGTCSDDSDGDWDKTAEHMILNYAESGHPTFRVIRVLTGDELRSKVNGINSIHFICSR